jgi:hypothetical protein
MVLIELVGLYLFRLQKRNEKTERQVSRTDNKCPLLVSLFRQS